MLFSSATRSWTLNQNIKRPLPVSIQAFKIDAYMDMQQYIFQIDCFNEGYALSRDFRLVLTNLLLIKFDHITGI